MITYDIWNWYNQIFILVFLWNQMWVQSYYNLIYKLIPSFSFN